MTDLPEAEQRTAGLFNALATDYDASGVAFFQPIADGLVSALDPRPGEAWLDMGCGRGAALLPLAEAVAPGRVLGLDVAPAMLDLAGAAARERGLTNVDVVCGSAQSPDPSLGPFDGIASSLVLFFLPDPISALRAWLPLLRPGGRAGVTTFGDTDPRWKHVDEVLNPYLPQRDARTSGGTGPFGSDEGMERLITAAGFAHPRTVTRVVDVTFDNADRWFAFSMSTGQRAAWLSIPDEDRAQVRAEAISRLRSHARSDGSVVFTQSVRHTLGVRPQD
jgi:ubiquinone/menaquinone biosynthesis C-methylase UbiE